MELLKLRRFLCGPVYNVNSLQLYRWSKCLYGLDILYIIRVGCENGVFSTFIPYNYTSGEMVCL